MTTTNIDPMAQYDPWAADGERAPETTDGRVRIRIGTGPNTIRTLANEINSRALGDVYAADGSPVLVEHVTGLTAAAAGDADAPVPVRQTVLTTEVLGRVLADRTFCFRTEQKGEREIEVETTPARALMAHALARTEWPGLPTLTGIATAPVIRPDGTLLQKAGYDPATGLFLASRVRLPTVPDKPTELQVKEARTFLVDELLADFPWVEPADRANHLGLMVTPVLRPYLRAQTPFALYDATMPGSGKTLLTSMIGLVYGQTVLSWVDNDEELRKAITAAFGDSAAVMVWDNIAEGSEIKSPILARLITERTWSDRRLGVSANVRMPNDRLWMATGNALSLGGDMASRSVMVRLDPDMPRPEERSGFKIANLDQWLLRPEHQEQILWSLLVLIADWVAAGAPRAKDAPKMRQFSAWAAAVGGLLEHHDVKDFLANRAAAREVDEEDIRWQAFLTRWVAVHGHERRSARELVASATPDEVAGWATPDPWRGLFLTDHRGRPVNERSLGNRLRAHKGRWHGDLCIRRVMDPHSKIYMWWVEAYKEPGEVRGSENHPADPANPAEPLFTCENVKA